MCLEHLQSALYTLKKVGANIDSCGTLFLIILVLLRSPSSSTVKFLDPIMRFSSFMVFLHLIILSSSSLVRCVIVLQAADRSRKTVLVLSCFTKPV